NSAEAVAGLTPLRPMCCEYFADLRIVADLIAVKLSLFGNGLAQDRRKRRFFSASPTMLLARPVSRPVKFS
ncbi:hypothetical protein, partial [Ruegeria sp.]|uniref:hypothetical protein n=1 Tax=Ruegeria sp. TaxID=1879320 RepID=UPI002327E8DA